MKKHLVIYFENDILISKSVKDWARENQDYFRNHDFLTPNTTPTSIEIDLFLVNHLNYSMISDENKTICFKLTNN